MSELGKSIGDETRRGAKDGIFVAVLGMFFAVIAYAATDDFIDKFSTIRLLAACSIGICVSKLFIMFPSPIAKGDSVLLTISIIVGCFAFLSYRYDLVQDAYSEFSKLRAFLFPHDHELAQRQLIKITIAMGMLVLSVLAISYPFSRSEWKRMLWEYIRRQFKLNVVAFLTTITVGAVGFRLCVPNIRFSMDAENRRGKFAT